MTRVRFPEIRGGPIRSQEVHVRPLHAVDFHRWRATIWHHPGTRHARCTSRCQVSRIRRTNCQLSADVIDVERHSSTSPSKINTSFWYFIIAINFLSRKMRTRDTSDTEDPADEDALVEIWEGESASFGSGHFERSEYFSIIYLLL